MEETTESHLGHSTGTGCDSDSCRLESSGADAGLEERASSAAADAAASAVTDRFRFLSPSFLVKRPVPLCFLLARALGEGGGRAATLTTVSASSASMASLPDSVDPARFRAAVRAKLPLPLSGDVDFASGFLGVRAS